MADLETNDDTNANDAFDAIAKQSESKAIETGTYIIIDGTPRGSYTILKLTKVSDFGPSEIFLSN